MHCSMRKTCLLRIDMKGVKLINDTPFLQFFIVISMFSYKPCLVLTTLSRMERFITILYNILT